MSPFFVAEGQEDAILSYEPVTRQESKPPSESLAFEPVWWSWGPAQWLAVAAHGVKVEE